MKKSNKNNFSVSNVYNHDIFKAKEVIESLKSDEEALQYIKALAGVYYEDNRYIEALFCQATQMVEDKFFNRTSDTYKFYENLANIMEILKNHEEDKKFSIIFLNEYYDIY